MTKGSRSSARLKKLHSRFSNTPDQPIRIISDSNVDDEEINVSSVDETQDAGVDEMYNVEAQSKTNVPESVTPLPKKNKNNDFGVGCSSVPNQKENSQQPAKEVKQVWQITTSLYRRKKGGVGNRKSVNAKGGRHQPHNVVKQYPKVQVRGSPALLTMAVKCFNAVQVDQVKQMGFGRILHINVKEIPARLGYWVLDHFDANTCLICTRKGVVPITPKLVKKLFGIPIGNVQIVTPKISNLKDLITKQWRAQYGREVGIFSTRLVLEKLQYTKDAGRLFRLNFMVLFASTFAGCTHNGSINQLKLPSLDDDCDPKSLD